MGSDSCGLMILLPSVISVLHRVRVDVLVKPKEDSKVNAAIRHGEERSLHLRLIAVV